MEEPSKQCGKFCWRQNRFNGKAKAEDQGSLGFGLGPGEGLRVVGDALQFPKEDRSGAVWLFRAPEASAVRSMCGGTAPDHHGHPATVQVELFALTYCFASKFTFH